MQPPLSGAICIPSPTPSSAPWVAHQVLGSLSLLSVSRGAAVNKNLLPLSKGSGAKRMLPAEGHLLKPKCTCPFACVFTFSLVQTWERSARWTKHHSIHFCLALAFHFGKPMEETGLQAPQQSEQRAACTRHPTVPRSRNPFSKKIGTQSPQVLARPDRWPTRSRAAPSLPKQIHVSTCCLENH